MHGGNVNEISRYCCGKWILHGQQVQVQVQMQCCMRPTLWRCVHFHLPATLSAPPTLFPMTTLAVQVSSRALGSGRSSGLVPFMDMLNHSWEARPPMIQLDDDDKVWQV